MSRNAVNASDYGLDTIGFENFATTYWNLRPPTLLVEAIRRHEGTLSNTGAFVALTGARTGRSPHDKFIIRDEQTESRVHWGKVNVGIEAASAAKLQEKLFKHMRHDDVFVQDVYCGAHPQHRLKEIGRAHV